MRGIGLRLDGVYERGMHMTKLKRVCKLKCAFHFMGGNPMNIIRTGMVWIERQFLYGKHTSHQVQVNRTVHS